MQIVQIAIGEGGMGMLAGWGALLGLIRVLWVVKPLSATFHYESRIYKVRFLKALGLGRQYKRKYHRRGDEHKERRRTKRITKRYRR